jgi:hypothetical protein
MLAIVSAAAILGAATVILYPLCPTDRPPPLGLLCPRPPPGLLLLHFDWNIGRLGPTHFGILDAAVEMYVHARDARIMLYGHADRSGPEDYNRRLSRRRALAAKSYLVRRGIPESAIVIEALGESSPAVDGPDGVPVSENRRVEIFIYVPDR